MDTTAYLTRHGWLGDGHSLHPSGNGIKKPLLVSQKTNVLGIGKKQHDAQADQWWARAFDATLKDLNVGVDGAIGKVEKATFGAGAKQLQTVRRIGAKWAAGGGLYGAFVRGQRLEGTITPEITEEKKGYEAENAGEKQRNKEERDEKKRRRKEKNCLDNGLKTLRMPLVLPSTQAVVDSSSIEEHRRKREKDMESMEKTDEKDAKKLPKEARRKERRLPAIRDAEAIIDSVDHVDMEPPKKKKKYKARAAG